MSEEKQEFLFKVDIGFIFNELLDKVLDVGNVASMFFWCSGPKGVEIDEQVARFKICDLFKEAIKTNNFLETYPLSTKDIRKTLPRFLNPNCIIGFNILSIKYIDTLSIKPIDIDTDTDKF